MHILKKAGMKSVRTILWSAILLVVFAAAFPHRACASGPDSGDGKFDPKEIIFEHLGDGYGWEIPFDHHRRMPLPVIVRSVDAHGIASVLLISTVMPSIPMAAIHGLCPLQAIIREKWWKSFPTDLNTVRGIFP